MTLNFASHAPFHASKRSDDDLGSMGWLNSYENGGGRDWIDPIDLLPADPFGMERSNLSAAIAGWFEDYCWNEEFDGGLFGLSMHGAQDGEFGSVVGDEEASISKAHEEDPPHDGLMLSLGYLDAQDLLSVERVCRSLHYAVQNDPLLWRCIHIDCPSNERITDDALLRLTLRAQGSLQCLSLMGCSRITHDGLKKVLESNPRLQKLSVSECPLLTTEGLIDNLKAFKLSSVAGIKNLKLGRLFSVSPEQYKELQLLLGGDDMKQPKPSKPRFYHCVSYVSCDDDRAIDIEMCSGCQKFKPVFDCPSDSCKEKGSQTCRACDVCIGRCLQCGRCVNDCRFEETFLLTYICSDCSKQAPKS